MSKEPQTLAPVSSEPVREVTYRIWYRDYPDMDKTFTKDFNYHGHITEILTQVRYELGHYGGIKAELIKGDMNEITD